MVTIDDNRCRTRDARIADDAYLAAQSPFILSRIPPLQSSFVPSRPPHSVCRPSPSVRPPCAVPAWVLHADLEPLGQSALVCRL